MAGGKGGGPGVHVGAGTDLQLKPGPALLESRLQPVGKNRLKAGLQLVAGPFLHPCTSTGTR
jgi:hypothetical protein